MARVYNFSAGPSMLPEKVLKQAQAELLEYGGSGQSVMEMSHRSKWFDAIITDTEVTLRRVMNIPDNYKVGFFQGGATQQFAMVPLNFMTTGKADYIVTGNFSNLAAKEAAKFGLQSPGHQHEAHKCLCHRDAFRDIRKIYALFPHECWIFRPCSLRRFLL